MLEMHSPIRLIAALQLPAKQKQVIYLNVTSASKHRQIEMRN